MMILIGEQNGGGEKTALLCGKKKKLHGVSWQRTSASSRRVNPGTATDGDLSLPQSGKLRGPLDYVIQKYDVNTPVSG
jgi:hypothetical protein